MKAALVFMLGCILLAGSAVASVIPTQHTGQKCGNGIHEGYELCEPETAFDICPAIGKLLKIAMVCDERNCACLPDRTAKDCGNQILEGVEMCDPGTKEAAIDYCPNISAAIGLPLKCDTTICDCVPEGKPVVISYCGDGKIEGDEDCETTDDCPKGRTCTNCSCIRLEQDLNFTVQHNVTPDEIPIPTLEDITSKAGKTTVAGFVVEDYIGEVIPEVLDYFDGENINIHVAFKDGTNITISVITKEMVVQDIHPYALNDTSIEMWVDEATATALKAADKRTETIVAFLEEGKIKYRPTSFLRRLWFFFFTPY